MSKEEDDGAAAQPAAEAAGQPRPSPTPGGQPRDAARPEHDAPSLDERQERDKNLLQTLFQESRSRPGRRTSDAPASGLPASGPDRHGPGFGRHYKPVLAATVVLIAAGFTIHAVRDGARAVPSPVPAARKGPAAAAGIVPVSAAVPPRRHHRRRHRRHYISRQSVSRARRHQVKRSPSGR